MLKNRFINRINNLSYDPFFKFIFIILLIILLFFRDSSVFLNSQFWAEDGLVFFQEMHDTDSYLKSLFKIVAGYLTIVPFLSAGLATKFPIEFAPTIMNLIAFLIQTLPLFWIMSNRISLYLTKNRLRYLIATAYVLIPSTLEIYGTITNSQWIFSILFTLIICSRNSKKIWIHYLELILLMIISLSGPFAIYVTCTLIPCFILKKFKINKIHILILLIGSGIQFWNILHSSRVKYFNSEIEFFPTINFIAQKIGLYTVLGINGTNKFILSNFYFQNLDYLIIFVILIFTGILVFIKKNIFILMNLIIGIMILFSFILIHPDYNPRMKFPNEGGFRYYYQISFSLIVSILFISFSYREKFIKYFYIFLALQFFLIASPSDYFINRNKQFNFNWKNDLKNFYYPAKKGEIIKIVIPPHYPWFITIKKK